VWPRHDSGPNPTADAAFPREVPHASGTATIPAPPARIVDATGSALGTLLALGVAPVMTNLTKYGQHDPYEQQALDALGARR